MTVYADAAFVVNFSLDFLCLAACGVLAGRRRRTGRLLAAGAIGGLYGAIDACFPIVPLLRLPLSLLIAAAMCRVSFGKMTLCPLIRLTAVYVTANLLLGGLMTALAAQSANGITWVMAAGIAAAVMPLVTSFVSSHRFRRTVKVDLTLDGKQASFEALADSGNLLVDPFTGRKVVLIGKDRLERAFGKQALFDGTGETDGEALVKHKWHLVRASTAAGSAVLPAFVPDTLTVDGERRQAAVAVASKEASFGGADGVVPAELAAADHGKTA